MTTTHFDQQQLAKRWSLSTATLERWRTKGIGPKFIRLPGRVIYRLCDIEAYENDCLASSTTEFRSTCTTRSCCSSDKPTHSGKRTSLSDC